MVDVVVEENRWSFCDEETGWGSVLVRALVRTLLQTFRPFCVVDTDDVNERLAGYSRSQIRRMSVSSVGVRWFPLPLPPALLHNSFSFGHDFGSVIDIQFPFDWISFFRFFLFKTFNFTVSEPFRTHAVSLFETVLIWLLAFRTAIFELLDSVDMGDVVTGAVAFSLLAPSTRGLLILLTLVRALFEIAVDTTGVNLSNSRTGNVFGFCSNSSVFVAVDVVDLSTFDRPAQRHVRETKPSLLSLIFLSADGDCTENLMFVLIFLTPSPPVMESNLSLWAFDVCLNMSFRQLCVCCCDCWCCCCFGCSDLIWCDCDWVWSALLPDPVC